jgi:hypothetical protein
MNEYLDGRVGEWVDMWVDRRKSNWKDGKMGE